MNRRMKQALKAAVSLALLAYVFRRVGWRNVGAVLADARLGYLTLYIVLGLVAVAVSAWKWRVLTRSRSLRAGYLYLLGLYFVGMFFNQILPTSVGGDVVRAYELGRRESDGPEALASVFAERYTGLVVLVVFAVVATPLNPVLRSMPAVWLLLVLAVAGLIMGSWLVFDARVRTTVEARLTGERLSGLFGKAARTQVAIAAYRHDRGALILAMSLSVVFYVLAVLLTWAGCMTFGAEVSLATLATAVPLMLLLFLIPISIGGLGLHEWAYTAVLALVGVPAAVGLSVGLLYRARSVLFGLAGGTLYPFLSSGGADRAVRQ